MSYLLQTFTAFYALKLEFKQDWRTSPDFCRGVLNEPVKKTIYSITCHILTFHQQKMFIRLKILSPPGQVFLQVANADFLYAIEQLLLSGSNSHWLFGPYTGIEVNAKLGLEFWSQLLTPELVGQ